MGSGTERDGICDTMKNRTSFILIIFTVLVFTANGHAATYAATSCSEYGTGSVANPSAGSYLYEVNLENATPADGDVITLPAGDCVWDQQFTVSFTANVTVSGATVCTGDGAPGLDNLSCTDNTIIEDGVGSPTGFTWVINCASGKTFRLSGLTFIPHAGTSVGKLFNFSGGPWPFSNLRIDHTHWYNWPNISDYMVQILDNFGVMDHNLFVDSFEDAFEINMQDYAGDQHGDGSWNSDTLPGSGNAFFVEDNHFESTQMTNGSQPIIGSDGGGTRTVVRYNTLVNHAVSGHGTETPGRGRGQRYYSAYNNAFVCNQSAGHNCQFADQFRSGTGFFFNNTLTYENISHNPNWTPAVSIQAYRNSNSLGGWGWGDGTGPWDQNDGQAFVGSQSTLTSANNSTNQYGDTSQTWTDHQFQWSPGNSTAYVLVDLTACGNLSTCTADIIDNIGDTLTTTAEREFPINFSVHDKYVIESVKVYDSGTIQGGFGTGYTAPAGGVSTTAQIGSCSGLEIDIASVDGVGGITSASVTAGHAGSGCSVGNVNGVTQGSGAKAEVYVTAVSSGAVTSFSLASNGDAPDSSKSWLAGKWYSGSPGAPYSVRDIDQGIGSAANAGNTSDVFYYDCFKNNGNGYETVVAGDRYEILHATILIDQPGRGKGQALSGVPASPVGWTAGANDQLEPIYVWGNSLTNVPTLVGNNNQGRELVSRDWYDDSTGGVSSGSTLPGTCTPQQAFWNTSANGGVGELYQCTAANSWTAYYEPYTYPHPLDSGAGGGGSGAAPVTMSGATIQGAVIK
jgi:hypothetical protein